MFRPLLARARRSVSVRPTRLLLLIASIAFLALTGVETASPTLAASPARIGWSNPFDISSPSGNGIDSNFPFLALGHGSGNPDLHVVWINGAAGSSPWRARYALSTDNGNSFSTPADVLSTNGSSDSSTMGTIVAAVDTQGQTHVVWSERPNTTSAPRYSNIYYRRRNTDGTWTPALNKDPIRIANTIFKSGGGTGDAYSYFPDLDVSVNAGIIHIVWAGANSGGDPNANWAIYYANSVNGGQSWGNFGHASDIRTGEGYYVSPYVLGAPDGSAHVAWQVGFGGIGSKIVLANHYLNVSSQTGVGTWSGIDTVEGGYGQTPRLARDPGTGTIYCAFQSIASNGTDHNIAVAFWLGAGSGWSKPKTATSNTKNLAKFIAANPSIVVTDSHDIYVAYDVTTDAVTDNEGVYTVHSTDSVQWDAPQSVQANVRATVPTLRFANGQLYIVYSMFGDNGRQVYLEKATVGSVSNQSQATFSTQPVGGVAGQKLATQPVVTVTNTQGQPDTTYTGPITIALNGGTLTGTKTVNAVAGVATFTDLATTTAGTNLTLTATGTDINSATSATFTVTPGAPTALVFQTQPDGAVAGKPFTTQPQVALVDSFGNIATTATASVTVAIKPNSGVSGATLSGTTTVSAVNGVATFTDLAIDKSGPGYGLTASSTGLTSAESKPFTVSGRPATAYLGMALRNVVQTGGKTYVATLQITNATGQDIPAQTPISFSLVGLPFDATDRTGNTITGGATWSKLSRTNGTASLTNTLTQGGSLTLTLQFTLTGTISAKGPTLRASLRFNRTTYSSNSLTTATTDGTTVPLKVNTALRGQARVSGTFFANNEPIIVNLTPTISGTATTTKANSRGVVSLRIAKLTKGTYTVTLTGQWSGVVGTATLTIP